MWPMQVRTCGVMALASLLAACALSDTVADLLPAPNADRMDAGADAGEPDAATGAPGSDGGLCLGSLAAQTFRRALCACEALDLALWGLSTDAYDSTSGPYAASNAFTNAGHVGVNGALTGSTPIHIGGSLTVADALGPASLPALVVGGDLRVGGPLTSASSVEVAQNLWLASDLQGSLSLHVAGNLIQAEAGTRGSAVQLRVDGSDLREPVAVPDPCACSADSLLDIHSIVAAAKAHNDNAAAGIAPDRLTDTLTDDRIELPDGQRVFLTTVSLVGNVTFVVQGRSTLVVETVISVAGSVNLEIGPEGELDLFVGDNVSIGVIQEPPPTGSRPARVRVYSGGTYFHGQVFAAANVYAPHADALVIDNDLYGSLFARNITTAGGELRVHYDTSVLAEGRDCDWFDLTAAP